MIILKIIGLVLLGLVVLVLTALLLVLLIPIRYHVEGSYADGATNGGIHAQWFFRMVRFDIKAEQGELGDPEIRILGRRVLLSDQKGEAS